MRNLDTAQMRRGVVLEKVQVHPVLIPITPALIANQHVNIYRYQVAPSDVLKINVWQHPEFDFASSMGIPSGASASATQPGGQSDYLVNTDGYIYYPLIGYVHVAGKTVEQIRKIMSSRLKKYVPNPEIIIQVSAYRGQKVYVLGEVGRTGYIPINDQPLSVADGLVQSGGLNQETSDPRYIYVIRGSYTEPRIFWLNASTPDKFLLAQQFSLQPRDILFVSPAPITRLNRVWGQILPIIQSIWFTQSIIKNS
ncbi:MAG: hypothetical protein A3F67_00415 [Verrucomicrobia bacterium RIFCSPHIGHO2_12_FULL_41_10]|nr:MAG: hypothetical protein A3F67_00415 [Verrucomicrobia bacterium RIFCSPHIGHO2_12_FULL_41_10]